MPANVVHSPQHTTMVNHLWFWVGRTLEWLGNRITMHSELAWVQLHSWPSYISSCNSKWNQTKLNHHNMRKTKKNCWALRTQWGQGLWLCSLKHRWVHIKAISTGNFQLCSHVYYSYLTQSGAGYCSEMHALMLKWPPCGAASEYSHL